MNGEEMMLLKNSGKNKRKLRCSPWSAGWVGSVARAWAAGQAEL